MPLQHAVLALLAAKPAHGYELRNSFEQAVGDQWGGLNIGQLYQILDRLCRDELITSERQPQPVKPDRVVHQLTVAGRAELDRWLGEPSVRTRGYRDDFFLKVMAAARLGDHDALAGVLRRQRAHLLRELRGLAEAGSAAGLSPVETLLIIAAERHVRADLEVVDAAEAALRPEVITALALGQGADQAADRTAAPAAADGTTPAEAGRRRSRPA